MDAKRIFITGGASGLGRAMALRFANAGWRVCIADVNDARGAETREELARHSPDALYLRCDVTKEEELRTVAEQLGTRWGGVDVVVNNAGVAQAGAIEDVSLADWQWIVDINLLGVVRGCKVFTPVLKRQGGRPPRQRRVHGGPHPPAPDERLQRHQGRRGGALRDAAQRARGHVLPHAEGRQAWWMKRLLPSTLYSAVIRKAVNRMRPRTGTPPV